MHRSAYHCTFHISGNSAASLHDYRTCAAFSDVQERCVHTALLATDCAICALCKVDVGVELSLQCHLPIQVGFPC